MDSLFRKEYPEPQFKAVGQLEFIEMGEKQYRQLFVKLENNRNRTLKFLEQVLLHRYE